MRIDWGAYSGSEIEKIAAMCIAIEKPNSINITPSQGDGGIDILDKDSNSVYQIKKFSSSLTPNQKQQIYKSIKRLADDNRVQAYKVEHYYLVMPYNPTLELEKWFTETCREMGFSNCTWLGVTSFQNWAAKYPQIIDYYINGFKDQIIDVASKIGTLKDVNSTEELGNFLNINFLQSLEGVINSINALNLTDVHFDYLINIGPVNTYTPPRKASDLRGISFDERLVLAQSTQFGSYWLTIYILHKNSISKSLMKPEFKTKLESKSSIFTRRLVENFEENGGEIFLPSGEAKVTADGLYLLNQDRESTFSARMFNVNTQRIFLEAFYSGSISLPMECIQDIQGIGPNSNRFLEFSDYTKSVLLSVKIENKTHKFSLKVKWPSNVSVENLPNLIKFLRAINQTKVYYFRREDSSDTKELTINEEIGFVDDLETITTVLVKLKNYFPNSELLMFDLPAMESSNVNKILIDYRLMNGEVLDMKNETLVIDNHFADKRILKIDGKSASGVYKIPYKLSFASITKTIGHQVFRFNGKIEKTFDAVVTSGMTVLIDEGNVSFEFSKI